MSAKSTTSCCAPPVSGQTGGDRDLGAALIRHGGGSYDFCFGKFVLDRPADCEIINCAELCEDDRFNEIISRYAAPFADADRRAIVSLWTLYYFSTLTICTAFAWLKLRRLMPVALDEIAVCLDRRTWAPRCFLLPHLGQTVISDVHDAMRPLLRGHIEPFANRISAHTRVSTKLLWGNAAGYLDWAFDHAGADQKPAIFNEPAFSDGTKNPLHGAIYSVSSEDGPVHKRRKVCCLSYCINEIGGCGESCPLPQGRRAKVR